MSAGLLQISSIWPLILIGLLLLIALVLVILSTVVRRAAEPPRESPTPQNAPDAAETAAPSQPSTDLPAGSIEPASVSFSRAIKFLRSIVSGRDFRYQIPWYLVIGDPGCGKSALLTGSGTNLNPDERHGSGRKSLEWQFLDQGILIGVSGRYFRGISREEHDWNKLLKLLQNNRPRRPLDGLVLAISATGLTGPAAYDETQLSARAARYAEALAQAQRTLGFTFPVYVIVTKCDEIPGFGAFCRELPGSTRDDIFGWSCPYNLEAAFTPDWIDEAFDSIAHDLQRLQSEIFVERPAITAPEDVFLFPEEFAQLRTPLQIYLDRLFRETAYRESFRFRGLYFCGDPSDTPAPVHQATPIAASTDEWLAEIQPPAPVKPEIAPRKIPHYVKALFEQRVFPESGVARPLGRVFLARSRRVTGIQTAAAALAAIFLLGTWIGYRGLSSDRTKLRPALELMNKSPDGHSLLLALAPAANVRFHSWFLPASWWASADDDVTRVMTYACNRWILNTLRDGLMARKQALLYPKTTSAQTAPAGNTGDGDGADSQDAPAVLNIEATAEFQELNRFVNDLQSLHDNISIYENLRREGQMQDVERMRQLLGYLGLGEVQPTGHLAAALRAATAQPVDITAADRATAMEKMRLMIGQLFETWFDNNPLLSDVDALRQAIVNLEQGRRTSFDDMKNLLTLLDQVDNDFASPTFHWVSSPTLELAAPIQRVVTNPIDAQNPVVSDYAKQIGEGYLTKLRRDLLAERTAMTDYILVKDPIALSAGSKQLQLALENTMNLRFIANAVTDPHVIQIVVDPTKRLLWRPEPLQEALRLLDIYDDFVNNGLRGAPQQLTLVLKRVALDQLKKNVQDLVAGAQQFQPRAVTRTQANLDADTVPEVNSFRDATELLLQLATRLQPLGAIEIRNSIMQVTIRQADSILHTLNDRLDADHPYFAKPGNWTGSGSVAQASYEVRNAQGLADYLTAQRNRIKFLEQQAEPLVPFLNQWLPMRGEQENQLITTWEQIIQDFHDYDAKRPGSSLTALEDFILNDMDKITPENACGEKLGSGSGEADDFFVEVRNNLRIDTSQRCRVVSAADVCKSYTAIANAFNEKLAGKFPFARLASGKTPQEQVAPEAIAEFYSLYDANEKTARSTLNLDSRFGSAARPALQFLDAIAALRPLVFPASADGGKEPALTLDFVPAFRTNRAAELDGNQIIDWTMQVGGQIFRQREPEHPGRWRPGNPVRLSLRWANDSVYAPDYDGQPELHIRGDRNAFFEFTTRWALFGFLRRYEAPPSETAQSGENQPYTLRFHVRTKRDPKWAVDPSAPASGSATVYMHMTISLPGSRTPIAIPTFPVAAPSLGSSCGGVN